MKISVEQIATLAYLELSPSEIKAFESQFDEILNYVDQLNKVPMNASQAKSMGYFHVQTAFYKNLGLHPLESLRKDDASEPVQSLVLTNEEALANAPKSSGIPGELLFEVPSIIKPRT